MGSTAPGHELSFMEALDDNYVMHTYARREVGFVSGKGVELTDTEGRRYVDFLSGIGTMSLGYCDPAVTAAIQAQAATLTHVSNLYHIENRGELAAKLVSLFGVPGKVFFANSGAEANEAAIKLARKWAHSNKPAATTIVTALNSFHGRTLATVAATGQPARALPFAPVTPGFAHVAFNDVDALEAAIGEDTIAFMIEVVQGESGVWVASDEYVQRAAELCRASNTLLIVDEVQSGLYRTGYPFAFQHYGVHPDVITSAKALGSGFPVAAAIASDEVAAAFVPGDHGSTFGGGPLACAVALATLNRFAALEIADHVVAMGEYLREALATVPGLSQVRGRGLMVGFSLGDNLAAGMTAKELSDALLDAGYLVNAIGDRHVRLLPPLIVEKTHIDGLISAINGIIEGHN